MILAIYLVGIVVNLFIVKKFIQNMPDTEYLSLEGRGWDFGDTMFAVGLAIAWPMSLPLVILHTIFKRI